MHSYFEEQALTTKVNHTLDLNEADEWCESLYDTLADTITIYTYHLPSAISPQEARATFTRWVNQIYSEEGTTPWCELH